MLVCTVREAGQVDELIVDTPDVLSARPLVGSTLDQLSELVLVVDGHHFRHCHDSSDVFGHTELI